LLAQAPLLSGAGSGGGGGARGATSAVPLGRPPRGSVGRGTLARPRSIGGSLYTLARSMRLFPTALSPHR